MVDNIILDTLTNPTLAKGSSPLISTKSGERDGTRGGGQPDGQLYNMDNMQYLGAFIIKEGAQVATRGDSSGNQLSQPSATRPLSSTAFIGFRPANGSNGAYGSIMASYGSAEQYGGMVIKELGIPENLSLSSDHTTLPEAPLLRPEVTVTETVSAGWNSSTGTSNMGWMQEIDGRMFLSTFGFYNASGVNATPLAVFDDADDITNSTGTGWLSTPAFDNGAAYASPIPPEYQSVLGGTWMMGSGNNSSILTRWSQGPSMWVFDPSSVQNGDTEMNATVKLNYPYQNDLSLPEFPFDPSYMLNAGKTGDRIDNYNQAVLKWYVQDQLGYVYNQYDQTPQDPSRSTGYLEYLESSPKIPFDTLEPPPPEIVNNLWNYFSTIVLAFIVPGTRTLFCVGTIGATRYGGGYKIPYIDGSGTPGGQNPVDRDDADHYYWLFDMDDIINATNTYDPKPYARGIFDNNRWCKPSSFLTSSPNSETRKAGIKMGGFFDKDSGRMYISSTPHKVGFVFKAVVAVYQIV